MEARGGGRTVVERLSPLQSARPPAGDGSPRSRGPTLPSAGSSPQIVSLPPALDPQAETWAARFETPPPPPAEGQPEPNNAPLAERPEPSDVATDAPDDDAPDDDAQHQAAPKRAARWKTQVMGSMVPLEVMAARQERAPESEEPAPAIEQRALAVPGPVPGPGPTAAGLAQPYRVAHNAEPVQRQAPTPMASTIVQQDMPLGWQPKLEAPTAEIVPLANAVLKEASARRVTLLVTGPATRARAHFSSALALTVSESGARVLLLEADFDSPMLHQALQFNAPGGAGFSQQLMARRHARQTEPWVVMRCSANLQVLGEGRFRSPGLMASREFAQAVLELREQYHVVIVQAPSLAKLEELKPLAFPVQGAIVVTAGKPAKAYFGNDARGLLS
jgi:Mrp family chromosome partitioning ATPase